MQNCRPPSSFLTNTTALHYALWLGQIAPDSSISCRWFWTSSTRGGGIHLNHSLKGLSSVTFIVCSVEWVQPNSMGSNGNMSWYLAKSQQAASASLGGQESNPLKSSSSNNFPCLCLTVNLGVWGSWGLPPSWWFWYQVCHHCPGHWGFLLEGLWVSHTVHYHHDCLSTTLASTRCTYFVWWGPMAQSHLQSIMPRSWHWYILQSRPFLLSLALCGRRKLLLSPHSGYLVIVVWAGLFHNTITHFNGRHSTYQQEVGHPGIHQRCHQGIDLPLFHHINNAANGRGP